MKYSYREIKKYVNETFLPQLQEDLDPNSFIICIGGSTYNRAADKNLYLIGNVPRDYINSKLIDKCFKPILIDESNYIFSVLIDTHAITKILFADDPLQRFTEAHEKQHVLYDLSNLIPLYDPLERVYNMNDSLLKLGTDYWDNECATFIDENLTYVKNFLRFVEEKDKLMAQLLYQPAVEMLLRLCFIADGSPFPPPKSFFNYVRDKFPPLYVLVNSLYKDYVAKNIELDQMRYCVKELLWFAELMVKEFRKIDMKEIDSLSNS